MCNHVVDEFLHWVFKATATLVPVEDSLLRRFAKEFCFGRRGFSLEEIPAYFGNYEGSACGVDCGSGTPNKTDVFVGCVRELSPENQRHALYDLCDNPPQASHPMPSEEVRRELLALLVQADGSSPLAVELSSLTLRGIRNQWFTVASRLPSSPAGTGTAARALLESTLKTIAHEHGQAPDSSGDLHKLFKQVSTILGVRSNESASQSVYQITNGLNQIIHGFSGLSNKFGDRHGLEGGDKIKSLALAGLAAHAAGTISLFLVRIHKEKLRTSTQSQELTGV